MFVFTARWMYWVDQGRQVVERASMDGTSRSILHSTGLVSPIALALDTDTQTLYWIDNAKDQLESSFVNGSNRKTVITGSFSDPTYGLDVFQNTIYWTNSVTKRLYLTSLNTIHIRSLQTFFGTDVLYELAIVAPSKQPFGMSFIAACYYSCCLQLVSPTLVMTTMEDAANSVY